MNDEEKKAIEKIKKILYMFPESKELKLLLNLVEKQSKEIEDLKDIQQKICNEELITQEYVKENFISKNKIKAKIEEIDEVLKWQLVEKIRIYFEAQKEVLQSLLEKE